MNFTVKDPSTGILMPLEAKSEQCHHELGYRIIFPNGSSVFISNRFGAWKPADDHPMDPELLTQIGLALEGRPVYPIETKNSE